MRSPLVPSPPYWDTKFEIKTERWVYVPTEESREYGNYLKRLLETKWSPPNYYYHLRLGGHVMALKSHIHHQFFLRFDIKNFFGCIGRNRVTRNLKKYFNWPKPHEIAKLSTVRSPINPEKTQLPFGFVQSPLIASICLQHSKLGRLFDQLSKKSEITISVYMDDIIISSNDYLLLQSLANITQAIAEQSLFPITPEKSEGPSTIITSFNVELSHRSLQITAKRILDFRIDYLHTNNGHVENGILGYVDTINRAQTQEVYTPYPALSSP